MYEYNSRVRLTEVDQEQRMTLTAILNAFQDCSTSGGGDGVSGKTGTDVGTPFLVHPGFPLSNARRAYPGGNLALCIWQSDRAEKFSPDGQRRAYGRLCGYYMGVYGYRQDASGPY